MPQAFAAKLSLALKALSTTRAHLAADLGVDKSVMGKWVTGAAQPSAHNLAGLSLLISTRAPGFTSLDWDRDLEGLAEVLGVADGRSRIEAAPRAPGGLPLRVMPEILAATNLRASAYEGFYRSTRPFGAKPGLFIHDHTMIRRDANGLLRFRMGTAGVLTDGWLAPLGNRLFCVGSEMTSGSLVFGVFNGVAGVRVDVIDGLILSAILDAGRTITSTAVVFHRIEDLTGDNEADDRRFAEFAARDAVAPEGSISEALQAHLVRDIGPAQLALGGDWLLQMPVSRTWSE